ncbi:hypothetical protein GALMADRAFT_246556 [Galerina marginata CBS 339.88]|uniref:Conidiation protein 6 n=1 Tax=Galerina marginata (strain CBS 339.88) TaxID=685588 RepID=A0A067T225_GALM3|nr:hypothetical protein GALMADRAFT_246556 [Galerina marginata CBS 339.88]
MSDNNTNKNPENVARGLKAAIHNDSVSAEAKESAAQRLEQMGREVPADYSSGGSHRANADDEGDGKNPNRQRGGYKATLTRDNVSDEAKEHARRMLDGEESSAYAPEADSDESPNSNRVLGGYKATLKNPNVSDEAKHHAEQVLKDAYE